MPLSRRAFPFSLAGLPAARDVAAQAGSSVWVSHDIPPFLWRGAGGTEGYAFHLFDRVVKKADLNADLQIYPWARAFRLLQAGQADAALVVTRTPERETQFRWLFPVGRFRYAVYTRPELAPVRGDLSALRPLRVGALRGSAGHGLLTPAGVTRVVEGKDFIDLLALLNRGIVDAVFGPEPALRRVGTQATSTGLRITALGPPHEFYAVAGPGMSSDAVERVRAAYQQLVDTSVVAQLRKSHPEAWTHE